MAEGVRPKALGLHFPWFIMDAFRKKRGLNYIFYTFDENSYI
jgi:hypothetical protein